MGGKQIGFSDSVQTTTKKHTKREQLLTNIKTVVLGETYIYLIEQCYSKIRSKGGRPPYPLKSMPRIHLMQQWHDLSVPAMEDTLIEVPTMRRFAGTPWWACL